MAEWEKDLLFKACGTTGDLLLWPAIRGNKFTEQQRTDLIGFLGDFFARRHWKPHLESLCETVGTGSFAQARAEIEEQFPVLKSVCFK